MRRAAETKKKSLSNTGHLLTGLCALFFLTAFGLSFVLLFRSLYYFELDYLNIPGSSGYTKEEIIANYDALIRWCMPWVRTEFSLPTFPSSAGAIYHFEQVKSVFRTVWALGIAGGLALIPLLTAGFRSNKARFRIAGWTVLVIPFLLGLWAASDFNRAFVLFHELVFRNDNWIFDYRTDPVILILPEAYFMHCFAVILFIVAAGAFILLRLGRRKDL
jgi:integral membrane protein (TIGR01906 family)